MQKNTIIRTSIATGVAGLGLSLGGIALATAEDGTTASTTTAVATTDTQLPPGPGGPGPGGHGDQLAADLADALGVSESEVTDALEAVHDELAPDAPDVPAAGEQPTPPTDAEIAARQEAFAKALADELDLSVDKVTTALDKLHAEHEADARSALADRLDDAVAAGDLTQADKASVLKAFDAGVLGGPGFGGPGLGGPGLGGPGR